MTEPTELLPCPFCGGAPTTIERPDNIDGTQFFYAIACYCGRYSACAHKMAVRKTPEIAKADAIAAWNTRTPQPTQAQAGAVPLTAIRKAALDLYTPPFRHEYGYIRDANHQMVADDATSEARGLIAARIRGWGRIQYLDKPEQRAAALQDEVAEVVAEALNAYWAANSIKGGQHGTNT